MQDPADLPPPPPPPPVTTMTMMATDDDELPPPPELVDLPPPPPPYDLSVDGLDGHPDDGHLERPPALEPWSAPSGSSSIGQHSSPSPSPPVAQPVAETDYHVSETDSMRLPTAETPLTLRQAAPLTSAPRQPPLTAADVSCSDVTQDLDVSGTGDEGIELQYAHRVNVITDEPPPQASEATHGYGDNWPVLRTADIDMRFLC